LNKPLFSDTPTKTNIASFVFSMFVFFLIAVSVVAFNQRQVLLEELKKDLNREIELLVKVSTEALVRGEYASVQSLFASWSEKRQDVRLVKFKMRSGFELFNVENNQVAGELIGFSNTIEYGGGRVAHLNIDLSSSTMDRQFYGLLSRIVLIAGAVFLIMSLVLWRVVKLTLVDPVSQSGEAYRRLIDKMPDGLAKIDDAGCIEYANLQFSEILQRPLEEIEGQLLESIVPLEKLVGGQSSTDSKRFELEVEGKKGSLFVIAVLIQFKDPASDQHLKFCFITNISDLKETENRLRQSEAQWRALTMYSRDRILTLDRNLKVLFSNSGEAKESETNENSIIGKPIYELAEADKREHYKQLLLSVIREKKNVKYETEMVSEKGEFKVWESLATPKIVDNEVEGIILDVRDITEYREIENDLLAAKNSAEKANQAKSEFLSRMSHELRTPMNAILGFGQILLTDVKDPLSVHQAESVQEMLSAGKHLLALINDILDLAKIESGKMEVTIDDVFFINVVHDCLTLMQPLADERSIRLIDQTESTEEVCVRADYTRLKQVVLNLLSNAIKYNKQHGELILAAHIVHHRLRVEVRDNGIGIDQSAIERLFQPFERLEKDEAIQGTGIGLVITRHLVEIMGGRIGVESKIGVGSVFWFELPLSESFTEEYLFPENDQSETVEFQDSSLVKSSYQVLYVEDNVANMRLVENIIAMREDVELVMCNSAEKALELLDHAFFDLLLLDINLPGMSGLELMGKLRSMDQFSNSIFIGVSANAMPADVSQGRDAGFHEYVTKPIDVKLFISMLDHYLPVSEQLLG